jgi:CheY-like chemotaxis protein
VTRRLAGFVEQQPRPSAFRQHATAAWNAADGPQTLDKVAEFHPDLILLDIMMPKLSGFEVCKTLKRETAAIGAPPWAWSISSPHR